MQRLLHSLILVGLLLGLNAEPLNALARKPEASFQPFARHESLHTFWQTAQVIPESFELVAENDLFQLYADQATLAFKVVDKRSGYIWNSNLDQKEEGDKLNKTWTAFASSGISIDYLDKKAISKRASITTAKNAINFSRTDQGFEASINFLDASIQLSLSVNLDANGVVVQVPFKSIKQSGDFKLGTLYVYPFMGATRGDSVPGYMFIPDGSGSLIRFGADTKAKNMAYFRYYGTDLGMQTELPFDPRVNRPYKASIPVMGMVHGIKQNAFIAIVSKGASYGEIQAHPAGVITNFNFIYNAFVYNESYFQATNRSGAGVTTLQRNTNAFDVEIHYRFLTQQDSDYVGMARDYQQYLVDRGDLIKVSNPGDDIGIRLEFLGGEKEKILFWYRSIPMTTVSQMGEILKDLGIKNADVIYYGWQPHGASSQTPTTLSLDPKLGTIDQLSALVNQVAADGGHFYMYLDPQAALWGEGGYSPRNDLAMSITDSRLVGYNRFKANYYFNFNTLSKRYTALSFDIFSTLKAGLALDGIGSMLYSDFKANLFLSREGALDLYRKIFAGSKGLTAFYMPNDYLFRFASAYYDMPLADNGYIYTSEVVPFLQIVLSGYVPYYGPAINFSSNLKDDLLRQVDFGVYPSYFLSHEVTAKILNTQSNWIYSSSYGQWGDDIKQTYAWMNQLLGPVKGQTIIAREALADGVVATTYANGYQIVVNYNDSPYSAGDLVVNGKDAGLRKVTP